MGHFGKQPIRIAWFGLVFPALTLNYLGQGALLMVNPQALENPFYLLVPAWALLPMVVLATAATIIASQATISGAYSLTKQAIQLGYLPRMNILQTSEKTIGQVYLPAVNWVLLAAVLAAVVGFGSSTKLASAYGVAVTGHDADHDAAHVLRAPLLLALQARSVAARHGVLLRRRRRFFLLEPAEDRRRRLVPALDRGVDAASSCSPGGAAARSCTESCIRGQSSCSRS